MSFHLVRLGPEMKYTAPMPYKEAYAYDREAFELLYDQMAALLEDEERRLAEIAAGQLDLFSGQPVDADKVA
jgi:hypothetical protein